MGHPLELTRAQILAHRRIAGHLDERLPSDPGSLRRVAIAGLQDSMPRAAILSIHARVADVRSDVLDDPALVQVWGPGFSTYVVAAGDHVPFTLGRLPIDGPGRERAIRTANALERFLAGRRMPYGEAGRGMGVAPNSLRYATQTGRILIRWDGARQPTVWSIPAPEASEAEARRALARRHLHVQGPATAESFAAWAGIRMSLARVAFFELSSELVAVRTPIGVAWILASDEVTYRAAPGPVADVRLLPSGDAFWLLHGAERSLLVADPTRRSSLWTPRVWPGCLLLGGEPSGTWRRSDAVVSVEPWRGLSAAERAAVEAEVSTMPLPGLEGRMEIRPPI